MPLGQTFSVDPFKTGLSTKKLSNTYRANFGPGKTVADNAEKAGVGEYGPSGILDKVKSGGGSTAGLDRMNEIANTRYKTSGDLNTRMNEADIRRKAEFEETGKNYLDQTKAASGVYKNQLAELMNEARNQSTNAKKTYEYTQPRLKDMSERDYNEAYGPNGAMTLAEAGDPNNKIHQAVRDMYNTQGENVQRQGLASSGVLGALGAQNAASAFGAQGPMTVGQQQALYASSQSQAGQAFANAQKQMSDLRQQGINRGFEESDLQYQRGERAKGRSRDALKQMSDEEQRFIDSQRNFRNELGSGAADIYGIDMGQAADLRNFHDQNADLGQSNVYNAATRQLGIDDQRYGTQMGIESGKIAASNAADANNAAMVSGVLGALGTGAGAYFGGPGMGAAGGQMGRAVGQGTQPAPAANYGGGGYQFQPYGPAERAQPQYGSYNPYGGRAYQPTQLRQGAQY